MFSLFFGYIVFFYSLTLMVCYIFLIIMSHCNYVRRKERERTGNKALVDNNQPSPPGVSIVVSAYNEGANIVENIH